MTFSLKQFWRVIGANELTNYLVSKIISLLMNPLTLALARIFRR